MVSGLLGVLNSMSSSVGPSMGSRSPIQEEEEEESPDIDEEILEQELTKELNELRESEEKITQIKEGRLDEEPTTIEELTS